MSEPKTDMFGEAVLPPVTVQPLAARVVKGTKLVFGQEPPKPVPLAMPNRPAVGPTAHYVPKLDSMPPLLSTPRYVRPAEEHRIDEAQAASLLFGMLGRLAEKQLYELQLGRHDYIPQMPSADDLRIAAELLLKDPAVELRLGLLARTFREAPPAQPAVGTAPVSVPPAAVGGAESDDNDEDGEEGGAAEMPPDEDEAGGDEGGEVARAPVVAPVRPARRAVAALPSDGGVPARVGRLIEAINEQQWDAAAALVRHLPPGIQAHWQQVMELAQAAWAVVAEGLPDARLALAIAADIDSQPVRDALEVAVATLESADDAQEAEPVAPPDDAQEAELVAAIAAQTWVAVTKMVKAFPADRLAYWRGVVLLARQAWSSITQADTPVAINAAREIAARIDHQAVREAIEARLAELAQPVSPPAEEAEAAPAKPQRRAGKRPAQGE